MSEIRIAPIAYDDLTDEAKPVVDATLVGFDEPLNLFLTLARTPKLLRAVTRLGHRILFAGRLSPRLREIVILRVAWRTGSEYEFAQHTVIGARAGLTADEIAAVAGPGATEHATWSAAERAALDAADDLYFRDTVAAGTWTRLTEELAESEVIELVLMVGYYRMLAGFLNTAGVPVDAGLPGWPTLSS